jgi:hypothetical protein
MAIYVFFKISEKGKLIKKLQKHFDTYIVPATLVLIWVFLSSLSLANPKSEILGFSSPCSNILLALISRCIILTADSSCRYAKPFATPRHISNRVGQSRNKLLFPERPNK